MHGRQLLIAAKKRDCNPVWEPKNSCMHLHCFVGSKAKQLTSARRLTVWFAFQVAVVDFRGSFANCPKLHGDVGFVWWSLYRGGTVFWQMLADHMCSLLRPLIHQHAMEPRCSYRKHKQGAGVARKQRHIYGQSNQTRNSNKNNNAFIMPWDFADSLMPNLLPNRVSLRHQWDVMTPVYKVAFFFTTSIEAHHRAPYLSPMWEKETEKKISTPDSVLLSISFFVDAFWYWQVYTQAKNTRYSAALTRTGSLSLCVCSVNVTLGE